MSGTAYGCCEREGCMSLQAFHRCSQCASNADIPPHIGHYCSRECQRMNSDAHNAFHRIMSSSKPSLQGICETVTIAFKDALLRGVVPPLRSDADGYHVCSLLFVGCKDTIEGRVDYYHLYQVLLAIVFPYMDRLEITLTGPELTSAKHTEEHPSGRVSVARVSGRLQRLYKMPDPELEHIKHELMTLNNKSLSEWEQSGGSMYFANTSSQALSRQLASSTATTAGNGDMRHYNSFSTQVPAGDLAAPLSDLDRFTAAVLLHPGYATTATLSTGSTGTGTRSGSSGSNGPSSSISSSGYLQELTPAVQVLLESGLLVLSTSSTVRTQIKQLSPKSDSSSTANTGTGNPTATATATATTAANEDVTHSNLEKEEVEKEVVLAGRGEVDRTENYAEVDEHLYTRHFKVNICVPCTLNPARQAKTSANIMKRAPSPPPAPAAAAAASAVASSSSCSSPRSPTNSRHSASSSSTAIAANPVSTTPAATATAVVKAAIEYQRTDITVTKNAYYLMFQGRRSPLVLQQMTFLVYKSKKTSDPIVKQICVQMLQDINAGRIRFPPSMTNKDLEQEVHRRVNEINSIQPPLAAPATTTVPTGLPQKQRNQQQQQQQQQQQRDEREGEGEDELDAFNAHTQRYDRSGFVPDTTGNYPKSVNDSVDNGANALLPPLLSDIATHGTAAVLPKSVLPKISALVKVSQLVPKSSYSSDKMDGWEPSKVQGPAAINVTTDSTLPLQQKQQHHRFTFKRK